MPLFFSVVFWAANGNVNIPYVDALFVCVSASTVTGLATIDLSSATSFQQALLFIQICIGNPVSLSNILPCVRRLSSFAGFCVVGYSLHPPVSTNIRFAFAETP
jgi:hypothetical protein